MAQQLWSFIRNFTGLVTNKFYSAPQSGSLTVTPPFTLGAIFATQTVPPTGIQAVFATGSGGGDGFILISSVTVTVQVGTVTQTTGPISNTTGLALPVATDPPTTQDLANAFESSATAGFPTAGTRSTNSPRAASLVFAAVSVPAVGNQSFYVNGALVDERAVAIVGNNNPVTIGAASPVAFAPCSDTWIAGCFYHAGAYTGGEISAMFEACAQAKDLVSPRVLLPSSVDPSYMWSVKRGNFDARTRWLSDGSAAVPIAMVSPAAFQNGNAPGVPSDVLACDVPWMSL